MGQFVKLESQIGGLEWSDEMSTREEVLTIENKMSEDILVKMVNLLSDT